MTFRYRGLALARTELRLPAQTWWARMALVGASGLLFASDDAPALWHERAPSLFPDAVLTEYFDRAQGLYRVAAFADGRLTGALFLGPAEAPPQWTELRRMAGGSDMAPSGPVVCACFGVGLTAIAEVLASGECASTEDLAVALRAGNKCRTCLPELRGIVAQDLHGKEGKQQGRHADDSHAHEHTHTH